MTTTKWNLDAAHSEIGFRVRHMMLTNVSGKFQNFEGALERYDDSFDNASITFTSEIESLSTGNEERDTHLLGSDFFDAVQFPKMTFISKSFNKLNDRDFSLEGDLTLHGITKPIKLQLGFEGISPDPWGNTRAGFNVRGKLNRKDWGLNWNSLLETGGMMVGEEITLDVQLQFIQINTQ